MVIVYFKRIANDGDGLFSTCYKNKFRIYYNTFYRFMCLIYCFLVFYIVIFY
jgi:hypothetical protein